MVIVFGLHDTTTLYHHDELGKSECVTRGVVRWASTLGDIDNGGSWSARKGTIPKVIYCSQKNITCSIRAYLYYYYSGYFQPGVRLPRHSLPVTTRCGKLSTTSSERTHLQPGRTFILLLSSFCSSLSFFFTILRHTRRRQHPPQQPHPFSSSLLSSWPVSASTTSLITTASLLEAKTSSSHLRVVFCSPAAPIV